MSHPTLGSILSDDAQRDAVHVAIYPVIAAVNLSPGTHVQLVEGRAAPGPNPIGIVDPFLKGRVKAGERFYLCLYQQTVTSLRHAWSHPDIADEGAPVQSPIPLTLDKLASEAWMRRWAMEHMSYDYYGEDDGEKSLSEAVSYAKAIEAGHELHIGPYESARDHIDAEWWGHWERITGCTGQRGESFSCSC